jgi:ABC-type multidrug transport system fused ATPase/permease subunit
MAAGGQRLSGGQQQRLRLVRALMADPEVLILLDPTSTVDANTESKMAAGIARLRQGRSTVVFTTSTLLLNQADHVVLVIDGTVAAEGSHESLMADPRHLSHVELGIDATIGPGGQALDPAKVQQLALVRLILANPEILILDEATSLLNPRAARHLGRSMAAVTRDQTVIAIAHRLHTAQDADRIAVLDNGRITELGTHEGLLPKAGDYAALTPRQPRRPGRPTPRIGV